LAKKRAEMVCRWIGLWMDGNSKTKNKKQKKSKQKEKKKNQKNGGQQIFLMECLGS